MNTLNDYQNIYKLAAQKAGVNPNIKNSVINAIGMANAGTAFGLQQDINNVTLNSFVNTAKSLDALTRIAVSQNIRKPLAATQAVGYICTSVSNASTTFTIAVNDSYTNISGYNYNILATTYDGSIISQGYNAADVNQYDLNNEISTLTSTSVVGSPYTYNYLVNLAYIHNLCLGAQVTINGVVCVVVELTANTLTVGTNTAITGTTYTWVTYYLLSQVESANSGVQYNDTYTDTFTLNTIPPTDTTIIASGTTFDGLTGAADAESLEQYRQFLLNIKQYARGEFNVQAVKNTVLSFNGNSRCWVVRATISPVVTPPILWDDTPGQGQFCVYFVQDGSVEMFPSDNSAIVSAVQNSIYNQLPIEVATESCYIGAPKPIVFDFTVTLPQGYNITLNLQETITNQLIATLYLYANVGNDLLCAYLINAIALIADPNTNAQIAGLSLTEVVTTDPSGTVSTYQSTQLASDAKIPVGVGELPIFGTLTIVESAGA